MEHVVFRHSTPIQVRFTDIDMMAHVTNSMYLAYCDIARMDYFNTVLEEKIEYKEESFVIASITIDFICPIFINEKIEIRSKVDKIGNKSIHTLQHIVNAETREIKAVVKAVISGFDYVNQQTIVVPERWKKRFMEFDPDYEMKLKK